MKKLLLASVLISCFSGAMAADAPKVYFGKLDKQSNQVIADNDVSQNKGEPVCWQAINFPANTQIAVKERFSSPVGGNFEMLDAIREINEQATEHMLSYTRTTDAKGMVSNCWVFGRQDPVGLYTHTLKLNNSDAGSNQFRVVR
ncbi:hypothetical protein [Kingella negevensis]|uniref:hypothetical protein n=1 Tax=Kingella negevensis TaxID=1522312 RepID=UPI00050A320F|nr:hypothetical protein [Kingella negevensis]MDK4689596.1 hypothetical protein [Kingella negevensis]WII90441.1 hypothetical protein QEO93_08240 [Kingella negevensis]WII93828.1 hypothetical protein QEO94_03195 [Kingella negevensis]